MAWLRIETFCLMLALNALVMAQPPPTGAPGPAVTVVPPFVGDHSETWEEFPVERFGESVVSIFGGVATIHGFRLEIDTFNMFHICGPVYWSPSDGAKFMGGNSGGDLVTISFSQAVSVFGAYWGALDCSPFTPDIHFTFYDAGGNQIGADIFNSESSGTMEWVGWAFDTPVKTITYRGDYPVTDGMQATVAGTPTPTPSPSPTPTPSPSPSPTPSPTPAPIILKIISITHPASNTIHLNCVGAPSAINRIEWSPNLSPGSFNTHGSVMANGSGAFQYDDTNAGTKKFYRIAYP